MRNRTYGNSLALTFDGWVTRSQQDAIEYLKHNMTLITFEVDAEGKGEGTMVSGVKVKIDDKKSIGMDSALTAPRRGSEVERRLKRIFSSAC